MIVLGGTYIVILGIVDFLWATTGEMNLASVSANWIALAIGGYILAEIVIVRQQAIDARDAQQAADALSHNSTNGNANDPNLDG